jgi:hypothetical protein
MSRAEIILFGLAIVVAIATLFIAVHRPPLI